MSRPLPTFCLLTLISCLGAADWVDRPLVANVILPQRRVMHPSLPQLVELAGVTVQIDIRDGVARTTLEARVHNPAARPQEAELVMPVPEGCVVVGLDFDGHGDEPSARLLPRGEARRLYQGIVAQLRDPALMEFAGYNLIRSCVFPVPAGGDQHLRLSYEQVMEREGQRLDYVLPRSAQLADAVPWAISATIRDAAGIITLYSPSHRLLTDRFKDGSVNCSLYKGGERDPGSFRISYLCGGATAAAVTAYPDIKNGGGYFLLLAAAPTLKNPPAERMKREVCLVIDRSGSMNGEKLRQVKESAMQLIAGLDQGESFNVIIYNHGVERFAETPVRKDAASEQAARDWLGAMTARGGTNIHDALFEALRPAPAPGTLPLVLFLTDGIATVGPTREKEIRDMARGHNPHHRRIFTVGVSDDVNTHLLEKIADDSRATAAFIFPGENIEAKVGLLFERLNGPVLADLAFSVTNPDGSPANGRVIDVTPLALGDLYQGDQVLVLGRYVGSAPLTLTITGRAARTGMRQQTLSVAFDPAKASTVNGHVPRLWASRKIADLIDAIRVMGADGDTSQTNDPRYRELVDEIVKLSTEFGILTEYTAFLAEEGTRLAPAEFAGAADRVFKARAFGERSGAGSLAQSANAAARKDASTVNLGNTYLDEKLKEVSPTTVQPVAGQAYYKRGANWVDSRLVAKSPAAGKAADREIAFASADYFALGERLAGSQQQASLALDGDVLIELDGQTVLVKGP